MMQFTPSTLALVCAATHLDAAKYVEFLNAGVQHFEIARSQQRLAMFLAQISHESQRLTRTEENLGYSAKRLMAVWPSRFPTLAAAKKYEYNPKALANKVYADRMGNGSESSGDGWNYRGRGLKMLTGKNNYMAAEDGLGMLLTGSSAHRVAEPEGAAWTACWFWYSNGLNAIADSGDYEAVTRRINGGLIGHEDGNTTGLDDRVELYQYAMAQISGLWSTA